MRKRCPQEWERVRRLVKLWPRKITITEIWDSVFLKYFLVIARNVPPMRAVLILWKLWMLLHSRRVRPPGTVLNLIAMLEAHCSKGLHKQQSRWGLELLKPPM